MNIRKPTDYAAMLAALDTAVAAQLPQMELYCEIGRVVSGRAEKGAAVAASEYLQAAYPAAEGFSPRNLRRMRDFYRMYGDTPELLAAAMRLNWTQNVVIMEAKLTVDERCWYIRKATESGLSKTELLRMIERAEHSKIALGENEDTCYTVENDEFSEKNQYEEYPVYLPRHYLQKSLKFPVISRFFRLEVVLLHHYYTSEFRCDKIMKSRSSLWKTKRVSTILNMYWLEITTFRI